MRNDRKNHCAYEDFFDAILASVYVKKSGETIKLFISPDLGASKNPGLIISQNLTRDFFAEKMFKNRTFLFYVSWMSDWLLLIRYFFCVRV